MYDIIGDIHGHADELVELLETLGYLETTDGFRHPSRQAIFCGDFIDRGPQIPDVVRIVSTMVRSGAAQAVMGNHEFNALAYHTKDPTLPGTFLRLHNDRNTHQHKQTLQQFDNDGLAEALDWFRTLPPSLDLGNLRIVHACWSEPRLQTIHTAMDRFGAFSDQFLKMASTKGHELFEAIECVMKGPELALPDGLTVRDKEGNIRRRIRIRWFDSPVNETLATYSLPEKPELPAQAVPPDAPAQPYPSDAPPVFVGHYWLPDSTPAPLRSNVACLDYSIAKNGHLCGYRFDGESELSADRYVTVAARQPDSKS